MTQTNGGPAFPHDLFIDKEAGETKAVYPPSEGMSLRDYFAGQAIVGMLSSKAQWFGTSDLDAKAAKTACSIADALIAELNKSG